MVSSHAKESACVNDEHEFRPVSMLDWPDNGKESVNTCPICGSTARTTVHSNLTDRIFFCAPGVWTLYRCDACQSGYLDPRPTPQAIGLAYAEYYTHDVAKEEDYLSSSTWIGRRFPALRNSYLNARFPNLELVPSYPLMHRLLALFRGTLAFADRDVRHLPSPADGARLLDIGCGNGAFVRRALSLGYAAEGLEFDAQAVAAAVAQGLPVREGALPDTGLPDASYDVVTLSQVIEHLHDPMASLREIHRLLKPGGFFWLATPNMDAPGHSLFGADWRGLEPPRHLVLFSAKAMAMALESTGFKDIEFKLPGPVSEWFFAASWWISKNIQPDSAIDLETQFRSESRLVDRLSLSNPQGGEELIATAYKA